MPSILIARHGQASYGAADYDVLSELGHAQARALADDLVRRGVQIDRIVSGPLRRQQDTAAPIAAAYGLAVELEPRWEEYDVGDILTHHSGSAARQERDPGEEGKIMSSRDFQVILDEALGDWMTAGDDGPTNQRWPHFAAQGRGALDSLAADLPSGSTALVVTSAGVLGALCAGLMELPPQGAIGFNRVAINAAVSKVVSGRGGQSLVSFNEHSHLAPEQITYR